MSYDIELKNKVTAVCERRKRAGKVESDDGEIRAGGAD